MLHYETQEFERTAVGPVFWKNIFKYVNYNALSNTFFAQI